MKEKKVIVIPCSGIGKPLGTVGREAAYEIVENLCPKNSATACLALLVSGDKEAVRMVQENPCVALDGCHRECARKNIEMAGGRIASEIRVMDVFKENRDFKPETVLEIGEGGRKLVHEIARRVAIEIDQIIEQGEKENE